MGRPHSSAVSAGYSASNAPRTTEPWLREPRISGAFADLTGDVLTGQSALPQGTASQRSDAAVVYARHATQNARAATRDAGRSAQAAAEARQAADAARQRLTSAGPGETDGRAAPLLGWGRAHRRRGLR
jgi:hypothetical protein